MRAGGFACLIARAKAVAIGRDAPGKGEFFNGGIGQALR
jgi:hypothetical protein